MNLFTVHIHLVGIGFFLMMVCGVALWMFPRTSGESREKAARDPLAWATYFLLTVGLAVRSATLLFPTLLGNKVLAASAFLQVGGVLTFVAAIWPRIYLPEPGFPARLLQINRHRHARIVFPVVGFQDILRVMIQLSQIRELPRRKLAAGEPEGNIEQGRELARPARKRFAGRTRRPWCGTVLVPPSAWRRRGGNLSGRRFYRT